MFRLKATKPWSQCLWAAAPEGDSRAMETSAPLFDVSYIKLLIWSNRGIEMR